MIISCVLNILTEIYPFYNGINHIISQVNLKLIDY